MVFDDIVVGSGLSALGAVMGLPPTRKVLVIGGPREGALEYYDSTNSVPREYLGHGGLGNFWHGVIPTNLEAGFANVSANHFIELFNTFYPGIDIRSRLGKRWLYVPYFPIRTGREWRRVDEMRKGRLEHVRGFAQRFEVAGSGIHVIAGGERYLGRRLWLAAGTLRTPHLVERSLGSAGMVRNKVSDHVLAYIGLIDRRVHRHFKFPRSQRTSSGVWVETFVDDQNSGLFTLKPARFSYRRLDHGIEQRAVFGLPTRGAITKIAKAASFGLIAEALYNKLGIFPRSSVLSVYAQVRVENAYDFKCADPVLCTDVSEIREAIAKVRRSVPWRDQIIPSAREDLFIRGIHLHNSLDETTLHENGINLPDSRIQVIDASAISDIGCEHHSFKVMAAAYAKAQLS